MTEGYEDDLFDHMYCNSVWNNRAMEAITTLYKCEAKSAKNLCIFDVSLKLKHANQYDIGGAYNSGHSEFWFYYTTTVCPGRRYLMNIFVFHRNPGKFSVGISSSNKLKCVPDNAEKAMSMGDKKTWMKFNSSQPDTVHFIKTFHFSNEDRKSLRKNVLLIPISIELNPKSMMETSLLQNIKAEFEFGKNLFKDKEPDFVVTSESGKEHKVHKIVLAAHSPVIRDAIRDEGCNKYCIKYSDCDVELLLEYLYTGTIAESIDKKYEVLLCIADEYKLKKLAELVKYSIKSTIDVSNALHIAALAEKYNYEDIQEVAFQYIQLNPAALDSDAFTQIEDADFVKKLLKYIHLKKENKSK